MSRTSRFPCIILIFVSIFVDLFPLAEHFTFDLFIVFSELLQLHVLDNPTTEFI